jgi:hypothetical protein
MEEVEIAEDGLLHAHRSKSLTMLIMERILSPLPQSHLRR